MSEMNNQNQENLNNQNTTDNGANPLVELGIKAALGIGAMFTAYKIGKSSKKEDKEKKPKKHLVFRSPISLEEVKEPVEEEVKEEPEKSNSEKKSK